MPKLHQNRSPPGKLSSHLLSTTLHPYAHTRIDDLKSASASHSYQIISTTPSAARKLSSRSIDASIINLTSELDSIEELNTVTDAAKANDVFFASSSSDDSTSKSMADIPAISHHGHIVEMGQEGDEIAKAATKTASKTDDSPNFRSDSQDVRKSKGMTQVTRLTRNDKNDDMESSYSAQTPNEGPVETAESNDKKQTKPRTRSVPRVWPRYWTPARSRAREQRMVRDRDEMRRKRYPGYGAAKEFFERSTAAKAKKQEDRREKVDVEAQVGVEGVDVATVGLIIAGVFGSVALVVPDGMLNVVIAGMLMAAPLPDLIPRWSLVIPLLSSLSAQAKLEVVLFLTLVSWLSTLNWECAMEKVEMRGGEVLFGDVREE